ncbi:MAG: BRCT domain-containing protein [Desulfobacteraceae bacterium]|jgi:DNA ligase (NAD+)
MDRDVQELVETLKGYNSAYRDGNPVVTDDVYDSLVEKLNALDPENPYLKTVEPETFAGKTEVRHPMPMLSTDKAYGKPDVERFVQRVYKAAEEVGEAKVEFRVTAKLDGLAGRDDGTVFATRGNGFAGFEISSAFRKGVVPVNGRGQGLGEIVMSKSYFEENLADFFEHPRNMVVGIVSSDVLNEYAEKALADKAVHFVSYSSLPSWNGSGEDLLKNLDDIQSDLLGEMDYPVDGLICEVLGEDIRQHMGATTHHYRWQIAIKTKGETAVTTVQAIVWQVGRTGNVTPVMEVSPVKLSGATIRRVTAHNAGLVKKSGIGSGAEIEIIRSGEVIPKLVTVIKPTETVALPDVCPACTTELVWQNDFLKCTNPLCPAQMEQRLVHWFKSLGNADWFGIKTVQKLVDKGYDSLEKVYAMTEEDFVNLGFGPVQSKNLFEALAISRTKSVEDWRFLSAFGIPNLGKGDSRKILAHMPLESLAHMTEDDIKAIHGFGDITSSAIVTHLYQIRLTLSHMLDLGFNLERTAQTNDAVVSDSPISGMGIVFTGKMEHGSREDMQALARSLGANVQTSVTGKTDILVCGENVGAVKIEKAKKTGTRVISEREFYDLTTPGTPIS